jgi:hypothetical protein
MLTSGASKIKALPSFEAFEYNRSLSLTAMLASEGKAMRRSVSVPAFGKDAPVVANSLKSTMNYAKLRKLAKEDQRYGPSSDDLERSDLMSGILNGSIVAPRILTRSEAMIGRMKKHQPKSERQQIIEKWTVPGAADIINPPERPSVTIVEARRAYLSME